MSIHRITQFCVLCFLCSMAIAHSTWANLVDLQTERVVVFKDGYGLIVKSATGTTNEDGFLFTEDVPDSAVLGSFWAIADEGSIKSMSSEWVESTEVTSRVAPCASIPELLKANIGNALTVTTTEVRSHNSQRSNGRVAWEQKPVQLQGTITDLLETAPGENAMVVMNVTSVSKPGASRKHMIQSSQITNISGPELITQIEHQEENTVRHKRLRFDFGHEYADQEVNFNVIYFSPGVRWIPTYRLTGELETEGALALQGEILNELEDFEDTILDLVVGTPNFMYNSLVSPLSLEKTLIHALNSAAPDLMGKGSRNTRQLYNSRAAEHVSNHTAQDGPNLQSLLNDNHDLYVHTIDGFTLKKGDRTSVALWMDSVPVDNIHILNIDLSPKTQQQLNQLPDLNVNRTPVWHYMVLTNNSTIPWTTGPVMMLKGMLPLAQQLLTYTPIGSSTSVPVAIANNLHGIYEEHEVDCVLNAVTVYRTSYHHISKTGTVFVHNKTNKPATITVNMSCGGNVTRATDDGAITHTPYQRADWGRDYGYYHPSLNRHSDVQWEIELDPSDSKVLEVDIEYYAMRR